MYLWVENDFIYFVVMETVKTGWDSMQIKPMGKYFGLYPVMDSKYIYSTTVLSAN